MFCPRCKSEYEDGIEACAECGSALVPELPPDEPPPHWIDFEEVLSTFNAGDIALIKSILDGEGISYYFHGEGFNYVHPLVQAPKLMVQKDQAEQVREILKDLEFDYTVRRSVEPTED